MKTINILLGLLAGACAANATSQVKAGPDKPVHLFVTNYNQFVHAEIHPSGQGYDSTGMQTYSFQTDEVRTWGKLIWISGQDTGTSCHSSSSGYSTGSLGNNSSSSTQDDIYQWPASYWPDLLQGTKTTQSTSTQNGVPTTYGPLTVMASQLLIPQPPFTFDPGPLEIGFEHCVMQDSESGSKSVPDGYGGHKDSQDTVIYKRTADTEMRLFTGGRALSKRQALFMLSASAWRMPGMNLKPNLLNDWCNWEWDMPPEWRNWVDVVSTDIEIDGMKLGADGKFWRAYTDDTTRNVTPKVKNADFYTFYIPEPPKYSLRVKWLKMDGEGSHQITEDNGSTSPYQCVLDDDGNIIRKFPILYESISENWYGALTKPVKMQATPTFRVYSTGNDPIVIQGEVLSGPQYSCNFWQTNTPGGPYDWATSILADHEITTQQVDYYDPLKIQWRMLSPDKSVSVDLEKTECPVYVSLQPPKPGTPLYHTVAHLACSQGHATTESQAVANTWGQFAGLGVTAWDGQTKLYYYNPYDNHTMPHVTGGPTKSTVGGLLGPPDNPLFQIPHNGDCIAWAKLLAASLQVNGIAAQDVELDKWSGLKWFSTKLFFYVKYCDFNADPITGKLTPQVQPGVPGQNSSPTPSVKSFDNHCIVKVPASCALNGSAIYLDPSYGISAPDLLDYTHQAIAGWQDGNGGWQRASDYPDEQLTEY